MIKDILTSDIPHKDVAAKLGISEVPTSEPFISLIDEAGPSVGSRTLAHVSPPFFMYSINSSTLRNVWSNHQVRRGSVAGRILVFLQISIFDSTPWVTKSRFHIFSIPGSLHAVCRRHTRARDDIVAPAVRPREGMEWRRCSSHPRSLRGW